MINKKIAIVVNYSWCGISSPLINSISYFLDTGCEIDFFIERPDLRRFPIPNFILGSRQVKIIFSKGPGRGLLGDIFFFFSNIFKSRNYDVVIAFDYQAILRGLILNYFSSGILIYHNLELLEVVDFKSKLFKIGKNCVLNSVFKIITQDEIRAKWLSTSLNQSSNKFEIIYNSSRNYKLNKECNYFREKFLIPKNKKIILAIGSLIKEHLIKELVLSAISWSENKVLVLHGWFPEEEFKSSIIKLQKNYPNKIFISDEIFQEEDKHIPYASCDIGFVGYSKISLNHYLVGGASGKLFDFLMHGKPILAYSTPGICDLIIDNNVGILFDDNDYNLIDKKIDFILNTYKTYFYNCLSTFENVSFDQSYNKLWNKIINV